jgi:hypothetical protein
MRLIRRVLVPLLTGVVMLAGSLGASAVTAGDDSATESPLRRAATPKNPLAGRPWGVYKGRADQAWEPYVNATGTRKRLLAKIALRPKAKWFGAWISNDEIADKVRAYIDNAQAGNPEALVQMTVFRMVPWERNACTRLPTAAEQASYKQWTDRFARAIGAAHTAIVLQPDGPFALCAPAGARVPSQLVAYSARVFSALPHTSVYVEVGAADWPAPGRQGGVDAAVKIAVRGGVQYARGIALNGTHYSSTAKEVTRGVAIVRALAARGITGKHIVVNTSSNGHPFTFGSYTGPDPDNAFVCRSKTEPAKRTCVTLGIPPTANVTNPRWRQTATTNRLADPFVMDRALQLVRSTPY